MENIKTNSIVTGRAPAKAFLLSVTPNCPCGGVASEHLITVGASIARPLRGAQPIRIKNRAYRFCVSPTGDNGIILFCTRVLFHIAANFHRRTANGRPYGSTILEHRFIVPPLIRWFAVRRIFKCRRKNIFKKAVDKPAARCYYALIPQRVGKKRGKENRHDKQAHRYRSYGDVHVPHVHVLCHAFFRKVLRCSPEG